MFSELFYSFPKMQLSLKERDSESGMLHSLVFWTFIHQILFNFSKISLTQCSSEICGVTEETCMSNIS